MVPDRLWTRPYSTMDAVLIFLYQPFHLWACLILVTMSACNDPLPLYPG